MNHGPESSIGDKPLATGTDPKVNGLFGAKVNADTTALAFDGVNYKVFTDSIPAAHFPAKTAFGAPGRVDHCHVPALEILTSLDFGRRNEMEVGRIHIGIAKHFVFR
jgi:hypothetical protein